MNDVEARRSQSRWALRLVGPAIAVFLVARIDLRGVILSLKGIQPLPLIVSLLLVGPLFVVKAWRWRSLLAAYGRTISLVKALELYTLSAGAAALTPGAIGDFWKGLAPAVGGRSIGLWTSAIDRLYDMVFLVILGTAVAIYCVHDFHVRSLAAVGLVVALVLAWTLRNRVLDRLPARFLRFPSDAATADRTALPASAATIASTAIALVRFQLLVAALGLPVRGIPSIVCFVLTSGVTALPLSIAGLGTRDVVLVGYLGRHGVMPAAAVALSSLCLLLILWNALLAAALWALRLPRDAEVH